MFNLDRALRYWLYSEPTDMRKSFHTLSGVVRNKIGGDPMNGDVYIFVNKRRNRIKLLHYETGGMVIYAKMLDRGTFGMPIPGSKDVVTSSIKWEDLLKMVEGILADPNSRQARLDELKNIWKK
ncbi:MAG: IS66 family insertion sequence element accessory protein TnpB [Bacteroidales bacterium]|nr:IS66 family insertion sequence element accessory protein TnpB [Bacteroidales bacterium]